MNEKKYIPKKIISDIDSLFKDLNSLALTHPYLVVLVLHEYYRNLYSVDPFISFKEKRPKKRFLVTLSLLKKFVKLSLELKSYNRSFDKNFFFNFHKNNLRTKRKNW